MARKPVLVQFDVLQLETLDKFAREWCGGNRSRAIAEAVEQMLSRHAAHLAAGRPAAAQAFGGDRSHHTPDTTVELANRALTSELTREFWEAR